MRVTQIGGGGDDLGRGFPHFAVGRCDDSHRATVRGVLLALPKRAEPGVAIANQVSKRTVRCLVPDLAYRNEVHRTRQLRGERTGGCDELTKNEHGSREQSTEYGWGRNTTARRGHSIKRRTKRLMP